MPSIINARLAPAQSIETAALAEPAMASRHASPLRPDSSAPQGTREIAPPPPPAATRGNEAFPRALAAGGVPPASTTVPAKASPRPPEEAPGPDPGGLRQYRLALGRAAGAFRNYPPEARQAGLEGQVLLHLDVSGAGIPGVSLGRSSGHPALDRAAFDMMRQAAERTILPDSLRGHAFATDLVVEYLAGEAGDEP